MGLLFLLSHSILDLRLQGNRMQPKLWRGRLSEVSSHSFMSGLTYTRKDLGIAPRLVVFYDVFPGEIDDSRVFYPASDLYHVFMF